jgi:hypothetical protein
LAQAVLVRLKTQVAQEPFKPLLAEVHLLLAWLRQLPLAAVEEPLATQTKLLQQLVVLVVALQVVLLALEPQELAVKVTQAQVLLEL